VGHNIRIAYVISKLKFNIVSDDREAVDINSEDNRVRFTAIVGDGYHVANVQMNQYK